MGLMPLFDQTKVFDITPYGEAVRLSNEFRAKPETTINRKIGNQFVDVVIPAKSGFDVETTDFNTLTTWLQTKKKKSQSQISFIHRILSIRFPTEYAQYRDNIDKNFKAEFELIQSQSKNEVEWLGLCGFQNNVRLDKLLTNSKIRVTQNKNQTFTIKRK